MIEYERIDISESIDINKTSKSKECMLCHYWYFLNKKLIMVHLFAMVAIILLTLVEMHAEFNFNI